MRGLCALADSLQKEIAQDLCLCELSLLATASRECRRITTEVATHKVEVIFEGISLTGRFCHGGRAVPDWLATLMCLKGRCLANGHSTSWISQTSALPFTLDSNGPWFVEFRFIATKAPSGVVTPCIGLVDAATPRTSEGFGTLWSSDLSRKGSGHFAMSCAPYDGTLSAAMSDCQTCCLARLNWQQVFDQKRAWNVPIRCGFLVQNRSLTFYRTDESGLWHSGETVCKTLPKQIVPCMSICSYAGYAYLYFERLWSAPPQVCPHCDRQFHGFAQPWNARS
jgi:hypothetical protein